MPFVDAGHPLHDFFPPRVWAIRIPVILILLGSAVVGSFLGMVMIRSNRKKTAKAKAVAAGKKKALTITQILFESRRIRLRKGVGEYGKMDSRY
ncbi:MAG: hypothetical protein Q9177_001114 [Variospora cf. flavescens]